MEDKDLWTTFEKTGSVVDYLSYRGFYGKENSENEKRDLGERALESEGNSDRDDTVGGTYR